MYRRGSTGPVLEQLREQHFYGGNLDRKVWDDRATLLRSTASPIIHYVTAYRCVLTHPRTQREAAGVRPGGLHFGISRSRSLASSKNLIWRFLDQRPVKRNNAAQGAFPALLYRGIENGVVGQLAILIEGKSQAQNFFLKRNEPKRLAKLGVADKLLDEGDGGDDAHGLFQCDH